LIKPEISLLQDSSWQADLRDGLAVRKVGDKGADLQNLYLTYKNESLAV
jgi:hypothetical protein